MLDYLRKIPTGRSIAIFTLTDKLRMIQGFNSDSATLMAALDRAAAWQKTHSRLNDDPGQDTYADFLPTAAPMADARVIENFISHEQPMRMDERVADTLNALSALGTYLSAIAGRKNLIWFSSTFPISIGDSDNLAAFRNYESDLRRTTDVLTLARVAVYPMDPGALATPAMFSATQQQGGQDIVSQASSTFDAHVTADTIAEATGGRAFHSTTDLAGAIGTVTELGANYYTLAYVPRDKNYDDKFRKLVVKVDAPKARLDYRRGYYAEDPDKGGIAGLAHPPRTASVLLRGAPPATDILFKVRVAPAEASDPSTQHGAVRYSVNWSVDLRGLNLAGSAGGMRHGTLALAVVAYNSEAKAINTTSLPASLILQPDEYRLYLKSGLQFHQELDLPVGPVFLRVAIVNTENDRAGSVEIPLIIKAALAQASSAKPLGPH
jgi:VWFA-related protein